MNKTTRSTVPVCFEPLPVLAQMAELYRQPRTRERFDAYLALMLGPDRRDLQLPLQVYTPMGREHVLAQVEALLTADAETQLAEACLAINRSVPTPTVELPYRVSLAVADDLRGGWTNRYTTDYENTFGSKALLQRRFVTPIFWTSDTITPDLIQHRIGQTLWRTVYRLQHGTVHTLHDHLAQEAFVSRQLGISETEPDEFDLITDLYQQHRTTSDHSFILTFLYGDGAAHSLGYRPIGASSWMGFRLAQLLTGLPS